MAVRALYVQVEPKVASGAEHVVAFKTGAVSRLATSPREKSLVYAARLVQCRCRAAESRATISQVESQAMLRQTGGQLSRSSNAG